MAARRGEHAGAWLALALALSMRPGAAVPWRDCTGVECPQLENCIEEALEPGACCASCVRQGCACEGYQYYDCVRGGFVDGRVPAGRSYFVDFGSTECSCPPGGGRISCQFMLCPELPPNCIEAVVMADSCPQCGQLGCVHGGRKYAAGHTAHLSPCRACHCPDAGGELICYRLPGCHGNISDTEEADPERHYEEDPYSYDQEAAEAELGAALAGEAQAGAPPAALGAGAQPLASFRATIWPAAPPRPTAAAALGPPAPRQAKASMKEEEEEEEEEGEEVATKQPVTSSPLGPGGLPTTAPPRPGLPSQEKGVEAKAGPEENLIPEAQAEPRGGGQVGARAPPGSGLGAAAPSQVSPTSPRGPDVPSTHPTPSAPASPASPIPPTLEVPKEEPERPQVLPRPQAEEDTDPNSVHSVPRGSPEGSIKDLIETCCAAGQQWAIDKDECLEIPESGPEGDTCRTAQKHCCISYLKEKSCVAGVMGAKEGEACGAEEEDSCGVSLYKQCCDCCGLGLRVRAEGQSCESNPNLGYPCNHVMLSCCEGEDPLMVPEVRQPPEPQAAPRRVSEAEVVSREALTLGTEAELPNSLPGDDQDECLLLPGELCQHLCINTVGSYRCACFPGFSLQDDGRSCRPDGEPRQLDVAPEPAPRPEPAPAASNSIPMPVPQPNTCKDNGPCRQVCRIIGGAAMCSCFPGYAIMADGVSCEDQDECLTGAHDCSRRQFCVNTLGSFYCVNHTVLCAEGFILNAHRKCVDINECVTDLHTCSRGQHCLNTVGSFRCYQELTCEPGYEFKEGECLDVDECAVGTHNCQAGFSCQNTEGSFYCQARQRCMDGFLLDPEGNCVGERRSRGGGGAEGWDRRLRGPRRQTCHGFSMQDGARRRPSPDRGAVPADVNECESQRCSQECANIYGSYQCYCRQGYQLAEDGHACTDIDECAQGAGILCTFRCVNVPGSYQCACPEQGYTMLANGHSCKDLDECALGTHNCSADQTCHNLQGSFRCLRFECPPNYARVSETKCERTACQDIAECQSSPARITYYQLSFQTGLPVPAHIFRIGPAPAFVGDTISLTITKGNEGAYFGTRRLNAYTGVVSLQRPVLEPRDFALDVEMRLWRQGSITTFLAKMHIFFTTLAP
ncbi:PREDICTED: fibulin-2 [Dipodomys ordii]|uniref:Fibulin-2 n=1 Tax=Dipodomys ordii TaxID=10020 RepID=A0A1S3EN15_DIPOR|nr:PREDICTED: fibulin-2 [Dipodomys ordii]